MKDPVARCVATAEYLGVNHSYRRPRGGGGGEGQGGRGEEKGRQDEADRNNK